MAFGAVMGQKPNIILPPSFAPQLIVLTTPNTQVTATLGAQTVSGMSNASGICTLDVTSYGTWTVNMSGVSKNVVVDTVKQYEVGVYDLLSTKIPGTILKLNENNSPVEFYVAKHDYESGLNGSGRTLMVHKNVFDDRVWDSGNMNAYASSDLDSWFNSTYENLLDADIRSAISTTKIPYTLGNGNGTVGTLERGVFALSATELGLSESYLNVEGSALPIASTLRIAYRNGGRAASQWTRSPYTNNASYAWSVNGGGNSGYKNCNSSDGPRPCFTLPENCYVDNEGNILPPL